MKTQTKNSEDCYWPEIQNSSDELEQEKLFEACLLRFHEIIDQEKLENNFLAQFVNIHIPFATWIADKHKNKTTIIGVNGAQGSGKSTMSRIACKLLEEVFNKSVLHLSIDDLYLSRNQREILAEKIHPLLRVRGVPGTHNVSLGNEILNQLINSEEDLNLLLPKFNKATDDLYPKSNWKKVSSPVDIVIFEGWCVGAKAQSEKELNTALNELEEHLDQDVSWRRYVNQKLSDSYSELFSKVDYLVMLKVPDMESVFEWRSLQEKKLEEVCSKGSFDSSSIMNNEEIKKFIMHYERITRHCLKEMPGRADILFELNRQHQIQRVSVRD